MEPADWKPRAFTEDELNSIDPVIRAYLRDVDVTLLIANRRLSVDQRLRNAQAYAEDAVELINAARARQS